MEKVVNQAAPDQSILVLSLLSLETAWNTCRFILICISIRYYLEIIKEVRQVSSIRLSDFTDNAAGELDQEFHEEMMNEYPGYGHRENVYWYFTSGASYLFTILLDIMAALSVHFQVYLTLMLWMCLYFMFSVADVAIICFMMKKCTNHIYFKTKWGHCAITCAGCTIFRWYLVWLSHGLNFFTNG